MRAGEAGATDSLIDSSRLAFRYASVLRMIESLTNQRIEGVQIIDGGSQNNSELGDCQCDRTIRVGWSDGSNHHRKCAGTVNCPGRFASLAEAPAYVASNMQLKRFKPQVSEGHEEAKRRYSKIEARYMAQTVALPQKS